MQLPQCAVRKPREPMPPRPWTLTPMGCLAQRNKGGGRRPGDIRGARYPVGL